MGDAKPLPAHMKKGNILEDIVALLHDDPNVVIQKKQFLPSVSNPERPREIDVLASTVILGRQMRIAFECKNYGKKIGIGKIDEFSGKLQDVGIPTQHGIFVSASDYTLDARQRAKTLGIRLLRLEGLTKNRLAAEVRDAFQSIVYLLAVVTSVSITNHVAEASEMDLMWLRNDTGEVVGGIPDLIWAVWRDGKILTTLGEHQFEITLPDGWGWVINGIPAQSKAEATVEIRGVVATLTGRSDRFVLRDADTGELDRARVSATFAPDQPGKIVVPVETAYTEAELSQILKKPGPARAQIGRIPLPRILYNNNIYWPPSLRVSLIMKDRMVQAKQQGTWGPGIFESLPLAEIEGTDLSAMWDEITPEHPAAHDSHWPWTQKRRRGRRKMPTVRPMRRVRPRPSDKAP